jgi:sulfur-oxidizing protein SoxZ
MTAIPRIKLSKVGEANGNLVQVEAFVSHLMESGDEKDEKGNKVPRDILNTLTCKLNGKTIFSADLTPSIAANPYFRFTAKAEEGMKVVLIWKDDNGTSIIGTAEIA